MRTILKKTCLGLGNMRGIFLMSPEGSGGGIGFGYTDSDGNYHWHSGVSWEAFANWEGTWYGGWVEDLGYVAPETFIYPSQFYGVYGFDWGEPIYYPNGNSGNNGGSGGWNPYQGGNGNTQPQTTGGGGGVYIPYVSAIISVIDSKVGPYLEPLEEYATQTYRLIQNGAKEITKDVITASAELCHGIYEILKNYLKDNDYLLSEIRQYVDSLRPIISTLFVEHELDNMSWLDLLIIWFFEIDNKYDPDRQAEFMFGPNAWTTQDIMHQEGVNEAREITHQAIREGNYHNKITHYWKFDENAYYEGVKTLNAATLFLGSYNVTTEVTALDDGSYIIAFTIENSSTWESATRLRSGNLGIIEDTINRGDPHGVGLGGTMKEKWFWIENYRP